MMDKEKMDGNSLPSDAYDKYFTPPDKEATYAQIREAVARRFHISNYSSGGKVPIEWAKADQDRFYNDADVTLAICKGNLKVGVYEVPRLPIDAPCTALEYLIKANYRKIKEE